jgi:hypothetical protein
MIWFGVVILAAAGFLLVAAAGKKVKLSAKEIATVARNAGFDGSFLSTAVAIALAESGGNVLAYNAELQAGTPQTRGSYGLWQIYRHAHPEFDGWNLNDPQVNANAAYSIFKAAGFSFRPWSTYKNGSYSAHLGAAETGVNA